MYNGKVIVSLSYNGGSDRETIVEKVGEYDYIHKEDQGIFVFNKYNNQDCYGWGEVSVERLYRYDVITDSDLKNIFAKFTEFVKK